MLELRLGVNYICLNTVEIPSKSGCLFSRRQFTYDNSVIPVSIRNRVITIVMTNPHDVSVIDEIKVQLKGYRLKLGVCLKEEFLSFVDRIRTSSVKDLQDNEILSSAELIIDRARSFEQAASGLEDGEEGVRETNLLDWTEMRL